MPMKPRFTWTLNLFALSFMTSSALADDWPQWRGPEAQGHAKVTSLPTSWSETENVQWKTEIPGRGWSSPVILGDQVWLTTAFEVEADPAEAEARLKENTGSQEVTVLKEVRLHVVGLDKATGKIVHNVEALTKAKPQWVHLSNSYASPTPVLEQGRVYANFGAYGTACVNTKSGKLLWKNQELHVMHENGPGSCPILWEDLLIVHMDGSDKQFVVALDKATGKVVWQTDRSGELNKNPQLKKAYGTPLVTDLGTGPLLLSNAADWLYAYEPKTGKELWKMPYGRLGFSNVARPITGHNMIYLATGFSKSQLFALRTNGTKAPEIAWTYKRNVPTAPSPILVENLIYFVSDQGGLITCLDAKTGELVWKERAGGTKAWGSPMLAAGKLYFPDEDGSTLVLKPGKEYRLLAKNQLDGRLMASAAAVDNSLFIRTDKALYRIGE